MYIIIKTKDKGKKKIYDVNLLLSKLDKTQITDFVRKECANDGHLQDRFLALGAGTVFRPNPAIFASDIGRFFQYASNRDSYREGVGLLRKLIKYGGSKEVELIATEQKSRTPRRPALIDELSKL